MNIEDTILFLRFNESVTISEAIHFKGSGVRIGSNTKIGVGAVFHANSIVLGSCAIGENCTIGNFSLIRENVVIGDNTKIGSHNSVEPHAQIGNRTRTQGHCMISEYSVIGDDVFLGPYFNNPADRTPGRTREPGEYKPDAAIIKDRARTGSHVVVLPGQIVEEDSFLGAGCILINSTSKNQVWFGNPARKFK